MSNLFTAVSVEQQEIVSGGVSSFNLNQSYKEFKKGTLIAGNGRYGAFVAATFISKISSKNKLSGWEY